MTLEEMEKQLNILQDIEAIKSLQNEYVFYLLNGQWGEMADFFAEDAYVNIWRHGKRQGRKEIHKLFTEHISKVKLPVLTHGASSHLRRNPPKHIHLR